MVSHKLMPPGRLHSFTRSVCKLTTRLATPMLGLLLASGCAHAPLNVSLDGHREEESYSITNVIRSPGPSKLSVVLYFSGGGSRAAALSYGVLKELAQTPLPTGGRMLDQVFSISAVSGGCFPAAYYCLYGDKVFRDFEKDFLYQNFQSTLYNRFTSPVGIVRLASDRMARSDLAAEFYDEKLFHGATFADLAKLGDKRPYLIIHSTNLTDGVPFDFTQEQFNLIGSDLSRFPLSRAVAASSAFPVLLTPITLRNYADRFPCSGDDLLLPEKGLSLFTAWREDISLSMKNYANTTDHPYIHLSDGGLSDNLGLRGMLDFVAMRGGWTSVMDLVKRSGSDKLALIIVNAEIMDKHEWDLSEATPTSKMVIRAMSNALINRSNRETVNAVKMSLKVWQQQRQALRLPDDPEDPKVYLINVSFHDIADPAERKRFNQIPTRLSMERESADLVVKKAGQLLRESPDFRQLQSDLTKR